MKVTVYMPDQLAAEVKAELSDSNVSAICQQALRDELSRVRAQAELRKKGFNRVEAYVIDDDEVVAFQGRGIGYDDSHDATAYMTPKGAIAIVDGESERLYIYASYQEFKDANDNPLVPQVARALGEKYVRELDI